MKIRTDFVTNLSSSSFCSIQIKGSKLAEILKKYESLFTKMEEYDIKIDESSFQFRNDQQGWFSFGYNGPSSKRYLARSFVGFLEELFQHCDCAEQSKDLIKELKDNEKELNSNITSLYWVNEHSGWGGDDESRLYRDYDDDFIREHMYLEEDEEVTEDVRSDFIEMVGRATSKEEWSWTFNGRGVKKRHEYRLI